MPVVEGLTQEPDSAVRRETEMITMLACLVAQLAHEVNNPLAGIRNSFHLIRGSIPGDHPHYQYVGAIDREITRLAEVARRLHDTYAPLRDYPAGTPLTTIITETVDLLRMMQMVPIDVALAPGTEARPAAAGGLLRHALHCMIQLAIEAAPPGSRVSVRGGPTEGAYQLAVIDRGSPLTEDLRRITREPLPKPSGKLNSTSVAVRLAMVRRSGEAMGGQVSWHPAEGGGNEYHLDFPLDGKAVA